MQIGQRYYGVASVLALLLAVPSASVNADGTTDVYSRNDDGTFSPTATYLVDHDEAIAAYELSPAFQAEGGGTLYSTLPDGTRVRIGSGAGFVQFLEDTYARAGGVASNQACDDQVRIIWKFSCPGQCRVDPVDCRFLFKVEPQITCKDRPECPPTGKTTCADFPDRIDTIRVIGPGMEVCFCDALGDCVVGQGFMVDEFTTKGPICECIECRIDAECDDGNICTSDSCDPATGLCRNDPIAGCCTIQADCTGCQDCQNNVCVDDQSKCQGCQDCVNAVCVDAQTNCTGCEACVNGVCRDDQDKCQGCRDCVGGACVDSQAKCPLAPPLGCQTCLGGACVDNRAKCAVCQICMNGVCQQIAGCGGACCRDLTQSDKFRYETCDIKGDAADCAPGLFQGQGTTCSVAACCLPNGSCADIDPACCEKSGGVATLGALCQGDGNNNGIDDACETGKCQQCGPGPHWIDTCPAGIDTFPSGTVVGIDTDGDCIRDLNLVMFGTGTVTRAAGVPHVIIPTEMVALTLTGGGKTLRAGAGTGVGPNGASLPASLGQIVEKIDTFTGASSFNVFFEMDLGGVFAYNQTGLAVSAQITCLPPNALYTHPTNICIPLFDHPLVGQGLRIPDLNLVSANHQTVPDCGDGVCTPATGENSCNCPTDCGPPAQFETDCNNGIDDDCDGDVDCDDSDCATVTKCIRGACCDKSQPGGLCISDVRQLDCPVDPNNPDNQVQFFPGGVCVEDGGTIDCREHTGACCDRTTGTCVSGVPQSDCVAAPTFFTDAGAFEAFKTGKVLKGIEDFEEANAGNSVKEGLPDPLQGNVPNVDPNTGVGFPNGLTEKNLLIQTNVTPGPSPPTPNPSANANALFVVGPAFFSANSTKVGEDLFLKGIHASLDLIFTTPNHTGVGFELSRFPGFGTGAGWLITVYDKGDNVIGKFQVAFETGKVFFGVWSPQTIGRINIFDKDGSEPDAIDNIQLWEDLFPPQIQWFKDEDCLGDPGGTVDCQEHTGACCDGTTGNCDIRAESECQGDQLTWTKDTPCSGVDCRIEVGACCSDVTSDKFRYDTCVLVKPGECPAPDNVFQGVGSTCTVAACCLPNGSCADIDPRCCEKSGGVPQAVGSVCQGDPNGNGIDDACETGKCGQCGPGAHWIDTCPAGSDTFPSGAVIGIDTTGDCIVDQNYVMFGPVTITRAAGVPHVIIPTEMVSLNLTGGGVTLLAGAGTGAGPFGAFLSPTFGQIVEKGDTVTGASSFDVLFEVEYAPNLFAYNLTPLPVSAQIQCIPPNRLYTHPTNLCIPLFDHPIPGAGIFVANLVSANHQPLPACGDGICDPVNGENPCNCKADCGQPATSETDCNNGIDDDCDGDVDCADSDCASVQKCVKCAPPGDDCFTTTCGSSQYDFAASPIPADFFDPGSDPETGVIQLQGPGGFPGDTIVRRLQQMCFDDNQLPDTQQIPIQLTQLNLIGCVPLTVTYNGGLNPEDWDIFVSLTGPQAQGKLTATKTHINGGTYTAQVPVAAQLTFVRQGDGLVRGPLPAPAIVLSTVCASTWLQNCADCERGCNSTGFFPGWDTDPNDPRRGCCRETCHANPNGGHEHCTEPPDCQPCPLPPTEGDCNNEIDDDGDGLCDCADPDCADLPKCTEEVGNWVIADDFCLGCQCDCDVDRDGDCDFDDIARVVQCFLQPTLPGCDQADLDCDNDIDFLDVQIVTCLFQGGGATCCPGPTGIDRVRWFGSYLDQCSGCKCDVNKDPDGRCDTLDLLFVQDCSIDPAGDGCDNADVNCDGQIDQLDIDAVDCLFRGIPKDKCCTPPVDSWLIALHRDIPAKACPPAQTGTVPVDLCGTVATCAIGTLGFVNVFTPNGSAVSYELQGSIAPFGLNAKLRLCGHIVPNVPRRCPTAIDVIVVDAVSECETKHSRPSRLVAQWVFPNDDVTRVQTGKAGWDGHPIYSYTVDLPHACLQHNFFRDDEYDPATGVFFPRRKLTYWISIQAAIGHTVVFDDVAQTWVEVNTGRTADGEFWGWHTTPHGYQHKDDAYMGRLSMSCDDPMRWKYDWMSPLHCSDERFRDCCDDPTKSIDMAFYLLRTRRVCLGGLVSGQPCTVDADCKVDGTSGATCIDREKIEWCQPVNPLRVTPIPTPIPTPGGLDEFPDTSVEVVINIPGIFSGTVVLTGPTVISRTNLGVDEPDFGAVAGDEFEDVSLDDLGRHQSRARKVNPVNRSLFREVFAANTSPSVQTEILSMDLSGFDPGLGDVRLIVANIGSSGEDGVRRQSTGVVTGLGHVGFNPQPEPPALAVFDVFFEVEVGGSGAAGPGIRAISDGPLRLEAQIFEIPPTEVWFQSVGTVDLLDPATGQVIGTIKKVTHCVPTQPKGGVNIHSDVDWKTAPTIDCCEPDSSTSTGCTPSVCPNTEEECRPVAGFTDAQGNNIVTSCDCVTIDPPGCHWEDLAGVTVCVGACPDGTACEITTVVNPDGTIDTNCGCDKIEKQACCLFDGTCIEVTTAEECCTLGGTPQGPGTDCLNTICPLPLPDPEACCFDDGTACQNLIRKDCLCAGGTPQGLGTDCSQPGICQNVCEPTADKTACTKVECPDIATDLKRCQAKCVVFDPLTGTSEVTECDCTGPDDCHVKLPPAGSTGGGVAGPGGNPCVVPDNGGTVELPPQGCEYLSPEEVHEILDGLPAGTTIELAAIHKDFICGERNQGGDCPPPGICEDLATGVDCFESVVELNLVGTGDLDNLIKRTLSVPVLCEVHTGPRVPGDSVQSFDTEMVSLQGALFGDPDFCMFRITAGSDNGLPSPGHTTLTQLPSGDWNVESNFDMTYRIEYEGCPDSKLAGVSGSTTGRIRMQTGNKPECEGSCAADEICVQTETVRSDGTIEVCCDCRPAPVCEPTADGLRCEDTLCPSANERCVPQVVSCEGGTCRVTACNCQDPDVCHVELVQQGGTTQVRCTGGCPPRTYCARFPIDTDNNGSRDGFECRCRRKPKPILVPAGLKAASRSFGIEEDDFGVVAGVPIVNKAIRVKLVQLYDESVCPPRTTQPNLSLFDDEFRWFGAPADFKDNSVMNPKFIASELRCNPTFRDWSSGALSTEFPEADASEVHGYGAAVVPCSTYEVQVVEEFCADLSDETCYSEAVQVNTGQWGDTWEPFDNISFTDIGKVVDAFKGIPYIEGPPEDGAPPEVRAMLRGNVPPYTSDVNFTDIGRDVDAFKTIAYGELGPVAEICDDGIDNNCNGAIDEDGAPCIVPAGTGMCMAQVCVVPFP